MHGLWYGLLDFFGIRNEAGPGYAFWSGFAGEITMFAAMGIWLKHRNCHVKGCRSIFTHPDPKTGLPCCRVHHPHL